MKRINLDLTTDLIFSSKDEEQFLMGWHIQQFKREDDGTFVFRTSDRYEVWKQASNDLEDGLVNWSEWK